MTLEEALATADQRLRFDAAKHAYTLDGELVPSVTTILKVLDKPALLYWAAKIQQEADREAADAWAAGRGPKSLDAALKPVAQAWRRKRDKAGDAGTQAHALIEHESRLMLGLPSEEPDASDEARFIFAGWREWAQGAGYKPLAVEARVCSVYHRFAGTVDVIAEVPGLGIAGPVVADWKSSKELYDEHRLQSHAYRAALSEMTDTPAMPGVVVVLPKEQAAPIKHHVIEWEASAWEAFLGALMVYRWKKAA